MQEERQTTKEEGNKEEDRQERVEFFLFFLLKNEYVHQKTYSQYFLFDISDNLYSALCECLLCFGQHTHSA